MQEDAQEMQAETLAELISELGLTIGPEAEVGPPTLIVNRRVEPSRQADDWLGRYPVTGHLGAGGMGEVLQVHDPDIGRELAAKVIRGRADPKALAKFILEAQVTGQLEHPNVVPMHELGMTEDGRIYFTMKRVEGSTLADVLAGPGAQRGPDDGAEQQTGRRLVPLLQIFMKVCDALAFAHSRGVIHRDLKPANIMVGRFGEVQLMDWGLAKVLGQVDRATDGLTLELGGGQIAELARGGGGELLATLDGQVMGTPQYMPPEQARGEIDKIDERSDIYALGAMLYQMLTGQPPHEGDTPVAVLMQVVQGPPLTPSTLAPERNIPWELEAAVTKAMAPSRANRYQTVEELRRDLEAWLEGRVLGAVQYSRRQLLNKWLRRHWKPLAATGTVLLALLALLTNFVVSQAREKELAQDKARLAEDKAKLADQYKQERDKAATQRDAAVNARRDLLRMSDLHRLVKLEREADALWPAHRRMIPRYQQWLTDARLLIANLPTHRASLAALRKLGAPSPNGDWQFAGNELPWVHDNLTKLVAGLERFSGAKGTLADIGRRREQAGKLWQRSVEAHRERWTRAIKEIRRSKRYSGLQLRPQEGLAPIGPDPQSKLWEFVLIGSGRIPMRGAGGKLLFDGRSAIVLVLLPTGSFRMGAKVSRRIAPNTDPYSGDDEGPVHEVQLKAFFISKYEITQGQWKRLTGLTPSNYKAGEKHGPWRVTDAHPVEQVSWYDCRQALRRVGLALPSEAQWEYAARGGTKSVWWTGNDKSALIRAGNLADAVHGRAFAATMFEKWEDGHALHAPVGSFRANPFGLHDVIGNMWEWCSDPYHPNAYGLPLLSDQSGRRKFPSAWLAQQERSRVYRGGGFDAVAADVRSAFRHKYGPTGRGISLGCRPIRLRD